MLHIPISLRITPYDGRQGINSQLFFILPFRGIFVEVYSHVSRDVKYVILGVDNNFTNFYSQTIMEKENSQNV